MTVEKRGSRAIVLGAGMGGLSAAAAISEFFDRVDIYEKDELPETPEVRSGANQSGHVHLMLRGGVAALEKLLPGIHESFMADGALALDAGMDFHVFDYGTWRTKRPLGLTFYSMSRPGFEGTVRDRVRALGNVSLYDKVKIESLVLEDGVATGVMIGGKKETADLIIDARGRGGALPRELAAAGYGEVPESVIGIVMSYVSGRFKPPPEKRDVKYGMMVRPDPPDKRYGIVCPIEGGDWIVSLGGRGDVVPPMEIDEFFEFAKEVVAPEYFEYIEGAELNGPLRRYKKPTSNWRHYDRMEKFPAKLIPLGDTITSFNPTFGQGMTVAANHALVLKDALSNYEAGSAELFRDYIAGAMKWSETAWHLAGNTDLEYPEVTGDRPENLEQIVAFARGVKLLGNEDPEVQRLGLQVFHMERSSECLRTEKIASRVMAKLMETAAE